MLLIGAYYTLNQFRVMKNQNKLKIIKYKKTIYCPKLYILRQMVRGFRARD